MSLHTKKNVGKFNEDVKANEGYLYTTHSALSSILANKRISDAINGLIQSHRTLVDIGCGDGVYTNDIKVQFPDIDIEGFDPAADAIAIAEKRYPQIRFRVANILDENINPTKKFDVAILRGVLHHLSDQERAIKNALKYSDTVIIVEPNGNNPILKLIEVFSPYHRTHEEQSFTSWQFKKWCREAGSEVVHLEYIGFIPFFFPTLLTKIVYFVQPFFEKVPLIREFLSAQIVIVCRKTH